CQVQSDDFHLLGTVENLAWEQPFHGHSEPTECNSRNYGEPTNNRRKQNHANNQVRRIITTSEVGPFIPGDVSIVVNHRDQRFRISSGDLAAGENENGTRAFDRSEE